MSKMSDLHIDMQELIHLGVTAEDAREMLQEEGDSIDPGRKIILEWIADGNEQEEN
jgi:hypothetical protein